MFLSIIVEPAFRLVPLSSAFFPNLARMAVVVLARSVALPSTDSNRVG